MGCGLYQNNAIQITTFFPLKHFFNIINNLTTPQNTTHSTEFFLQPIQPPQLFQLPQLFQPLQQCQYIPSKKPNSFQSL